MSMGGSGHHYTLFLTSEHSKVDREERSTPRHLRGQSRGGVRGMRGTLGESQGGVYGGLCRNNAAVTAAALEVQDPPSSADPV